MKFRRSISEEFRVRAIRSEEFRQSLGVEPDGDRVFARWEVGVEMPAGVSWRGHAVEPGFAPAFELDLRVAGVRELKFGRTIEEASSAPHGLLNETAPPSFVPPFG